MAIAMMLSWLVLSNHCALGLMTAAPSEEHAGCCGQSSHDGKPSPVPVRACCQSMQALSPANFAVLPPVTTFLDAAEWMLADSFVLGIAAETAVECIHETGPPEARSFAELVLQHGLRSHAPPHFLRS